MQTHITQRAVARSHLRFTLLLAGFSIPPPNTPPVNGWDKSNTDGNWEGLVNTAWGSHVYYTSVAVFNAQARPAAFPRPMTLTKFAAPDWCAIVPPRVAYSA